MIAPHAVEIWVTSNETGLERAGAFAGWLLVRHPQWTVHVVLNSNALERKIEVNDPEAEKIVLAELMRWLGGLQGTHPAQDSKLVTLFSSGPLLFSS